MPWPRESVHSQGLDVADLSTSERTLSFMSSLDLGNVFDQLGILYWLSRSNEDRSRQSISFRCVRPIKWKLFVVWLNNRHVNKLEVSFQLVIDPRSCWPATLAINAL